jgi:hypothetical protein
MKHRTAVPTPRPAEAYYVKIPCRPGTTRDCKQGKGNLGGQLYALQNADVTTVGQCLAEVESFAVTFPRQM